MPLGIQPARAVRSRGFAVSLVLIFVYYILLSAGQALAEQDARPAGVGLWLPNVVFGAIGVALFAQAGRERSGVWLERVHGRVAAARDKVIARLGAEPTS